MGTCINLNVCVREAWTKQFNMKESDTWTEMDKFWLEGQYCNCLVWHDAIQEFKACWPRKHLHLAWLNLICTTFSNVAQDSVLSVRLAAFASLGVVAGLMVQNSFDPCQIWNWLHSVDRIQQEAQLRSERWSTTVCALTSCDHVVTKSCSPLWWNYSIDMYRLCA